MDESGMARFLPDRVSYAPPQHGARYIVKLQCFLESFLILPSLKSRPGLFRRRAHDPRGVHLYLNRLSAIGP